MIASDISGGKLGQYSPSRVKAPRNPAGIPPRVAPSLLGKIPQAKSKTQTTRHAEGSEASLRFRSPSSVYGGRGRGMGAFPRAGSPDPARIPPRVAPSLLGKIPQKNRKPRPLVMLKVVKHPSASASPSSVHGEPVLEGKGSGDGGLSSKAPGDEACLLFSLTPT